MCANSRNCLIECALFTYVELKVIMKIVFLSNFINHHQVGLCDALYGLCGEGNFYFVQEEPLPPERVDLGYANEYDKRLYVLTLQKDNERDIKDIILKSDIIINCFSQGLNLLKEAMKAKKCIIWYSERLYKDYNILKTAAKFIRAKYYFDFYHNDNQYQLLASYYGYSDTVKTSKRFIDKSFQYGYFPVTNSETVVDRKVESNKLRLLFVGRLIDWKHPETAFEVGDYLFGKGMNFSITVVGSGYMYDDMQKMKAAKPYKENVNIVGSVPFDEIRQYYLKNDVFLFSSDRREGWGATLGEAMSYGCVPLANTEAGATNTLIENGVNGFIYDKRHLYETVDLLLSCIRNKQIADMALKASETIVGCRNYKIAAERLFNVCNDIVNDRNIENQYKGVMEKIHKNTATVNTAVSRNSKDNG